MSATTAASKSYGSVALTRGIRVAVSPMYLPEQSDPASRRFLFAYKIRIANEGDIGVRLISRRWMIVNAHGEREDVEGDGVVGQQPHLRPGQTFEYSSYCPLNTSWGTMEGSYLMERDDGEFFDATIARFYLVPEGA
jgi:ApaG protein